MDHHHTILSQLRRGLWLYGLALKMALDAARAYNSNSNCPPVGSAYNIGL